MKEILPCRIIYLEQADNTRNIDLMTRLQSLPVMREHCLEIARDSSSAVELIQQARVY